MKHIHSMSPDWDFSNAFVGNGDTTLLNLCIARARDIVFFITEEQASELVSGLRGDTQLEYISEELKKSLFCVKPDSLGKHTEPRTKAPDGFFPGILAAEKLQKEVKDYRTGLLNSETAEVAFSRLFEKHLGRCSGITLIDPFFLSSVLIPDSDTKEIFQSQILSNASEIEVLTKVPRSNNSKRSYLLTDGDGVEDLFVDKGPAFCAFIKERVESLFENSSFKGNFTLSFYATYGFPHDRHLEITFPDGLFPLGKSDFFALGSGFDTFGRKHLDPSKGIVRAQVYDSDAERMYGWKNYPSGTQSSSSPRVEYVCKVTTTPNFKVDVQQVNQRSGWQ